MTEKSRDGRESQADCLGRWVIIKDDETGSVQVLAANGAIATVTVFGTHSDYQAISWHAVCVHGKVWHGHAFSTPEARGECYAIMGLS